MGVTSGRMLQNRNFHGEANVTKLYYVAALDGSGDPTASKTVGITSLARGVTGTYVLTLKETYNSLLGLKVEFEKTTDPSIRWYLYSEAVSTTGVINLRFVNLSSPSNAANPVNCTIRITATVKMGSA
jgi:hypothetical protein